MVKHVCGTSRSAPPPPWLFTRGPRPVTIHRNLFFTVWSLALRTLIADRGKLLTALVGVVFSVVLVNIQGGFFFGLIRRASLLVDQGEADIWVGHKKMHNVDFPRDIPRRWLNRVRSVPGVRRAEPYLVGFADMTLPSGGFENVTVVGVDRRSLLGGAWNLTQGRPDSIFRADGVHRG